MKPTPKIIFLVAALAVMSGCSAQRRAERHMRRAVELCPEIVQAKAHVVDTVLTVGPWADCATLKLADVLVYDTIYAATDHGTVVVSLRQSDSALRVGFVAAPQQIHYRDTLRYAQLEMPAEKPKQAASGGFWRGFGLFCIGFFLCLAVFAGLFFLAVRMSRVMD